MLKTTPLKKWNDSQSREAFIFSPSANIAAQRLKTETIIFDIWFSIKRK